jgi:hypothetical protein
VDMTPKVGEAEKARDSNLHLRFLVRFSDSSCAACAPS